jgi:hypothetical protein
MMIRHVLTAIRPAGVRPALLALLAVAVAPPPGPARQNVAVRVAPNVWPDEQFEQWVFNNDGNAAAARQRLNGLLALQVEDVDRACKLTDAQRAKLQLAARGDVKRLFDTFDAAKRKFKALGNDVQQLQDVMPDIAPVQRTLQAGFLHGDSLVFKALRNTLTADQFAKYDAVDRERRALRHRANIELAVTVMEQSMPFRAAQRRDLIVLLLGETKPLRATGMYEYYAVMLQIGRIPEAKLRPLLDDAQWRVVSRLVAQYRGIEPALRQNGMMLDEDADADGAGAAPKK